MTSNTFAEYILTAPPRESPEKGKRTYQPIAKRISKLIGKRVIYEQPSNWFQYGIKMRSGAYDIVFDGPHFTAWRIKHLKHIPVVTLPGNLRFILFTRADNASMNAIEDLKHKIMCGMRSPNLATNVIMYEYYNVRTQPTMYESSGYANVYKNFKNGSCHAAVLRDQAFNKLTRHDESMIKVIHTTASLPNQTITISPKLKRYFKKIKKFLISEKGAQTANKLLTRFSRNHPKFIATEVNNYSRVEKYLQGYVKGW